MRKQLLLLPILLPLFAVQSFSQDRAYYQEPAWQPRGILPYADAINNNFWPKSPEVNVNYNDPLFDEGQLPKVPASGIYPRVLITPSDVEKVRAKLAMGEKAPISFRTMWARVSKAQSPFYALVTKDKTLGRRLAEELVGKIKALGPKLTDMDNHSDRDNLWAVERSIVASGEPDPPSEIWDLLNYDYLHEWMTPDECELARSTIARIVKNRISNFLMVPDHFMINNHEGFGMEYIRLMLLIEGQKGFDQKLFDLAAHKANAMLDWYLDKDGMCYESIKGWLNVSAFVAVGLRHRELLKHSHLMAKMHFFQAAIRWEDGAWKIRDEMRASAFHVIWMMHYYHPKDESIDFLYQSTFSTHPFLTDAEARWPDPVGICMELLLLYADQGMVDKENKPLDWTNQALIDKLHLPLTWQDSARGYVDTRNSWRKDDLHVGFVCKQDFYYGGHEGSENNRLTLWKDGVNWVQDNNMLATKATFLQNMLTVDGKGCHWPPAPGNWLGINETKEGLVAAGDGKIGYSYTKVMQVHPLAFPSAKLPYYAPFAEGNFDLSRDLQIAFQPSTIKYNDGYAHTDYGPWSGETRLVESYKPFNVMEQAYRTVQVAKGAYPYVLVIDDAKKDNEKHYFDWNISVPIDAELVEASTPEVVFQNTEPSSNRVDDIILTKAGITKNPKTGKFLFKKGDPLCLIRILWRNTDYGFPVPKLEKFQGYSLVTVPAHSISPEFRVLIYPYQFGDPMPKTEWNKDKSALSIEIKDQKDLYNFSQTDGGRTVLNMARNGKSTLTSHAKPAKPNLIVRGSHFNQNDYRYTRDEQKVPVYLVDDSLFVQLERITAPAQIYYTLDGTEPNSQSSVYTKSIVINKSCLLKASVIDTSWQAGLQQSDVLNARFIAKKVVAGLVQAPPATKAGLLASVYEINTKLYNDKGFFEASKIMLPNLDGYKPLQTSIANGFVLPHVTTSQPMAQQCKGFYRFTGYFYASEKGVFTFDVNSCGPVLLEVGSQSVIEATGLFHQQQSHRKGEVVLGKGWHPINLVVCDPLFWNINSLEPMPFEVSYTIDGGELHPIASNELLYDGNIKVTTTALPEKLTWHEAISSLPMLETGLDMQVFDRTGKRRDNDFLDIEAAQPFVSERVTTMETTSSRNTIRVYNGYFQATVSGTYHFSLPIRNGDNASLGGTQASCQNHLKIDDEYIVQHGVYGRNPTGIVALKEGWHRISIRFGTGEASCKVDLPDGQTIPLNGNNLYRPSLVDVLPAGTAYHKSLYELYAPTKVSLDFSKDPQAEIRYTLDGTMPNAQSSLYKGQITVSQTLNLTTAAFKNGKAITAPASMGFHLVKVPEMGSLGQIDFNGWDGTSRKYPTVSNYKVWVAPLSTLVNGLKGKVLEMQSLEANMPIVDVNVAKGGGTKPGFKLYDIKMRENALTVALWFKTDEKTGKLFGKDGYNAFGKGYKTLSCSINNGSLQAMPNRLSGGKIELGKWQFVVLTANENQMALYLNGVMVASAAGTKEIATDALDFFTGHHAIAGSVQLFDRLLDANEVKRLYDFGKE
ncbi:chitobiase/beta-hexosaminidase C-terminal domain-containing protein [Parasediminibacterium sp. JCM 36343]|uniref:chitobiase/beta-hexosaminidase C-terminal domain-containing protein n=1 Tax=Parasediminibacterium sp. JCM 36343 TaxID=3374279 RepID=UPI00397D1B9F